MSRSPAVVWTKSMDAAVRETYQAREKGGVLKLAKHLGVSVSSVTLRASKLGVLVGVKKKRLVWTTAMDDEICQVYQARKLGGNKALSYKLGLAPGLISARAAKLGLTPLGLAGKSSQAWTESDKALVRRHLGEPIAQIRARLYRVGTSRSLNAVKHLISEQRRLGNWPSRVDQMLDKDQWPLADVARGLGVKADQVGRWIVRYELPCVRYGGNGDRAVRIEDLRDWLREHAGQWDHRKADHFFLIDVLTYRKHSAAFGKQEAA